MKNELLQFLEKIPTLTDEEAKLISENINVEGFKKGTILLNEGEIFKECYFVLKGCVRQYCIVEGEEKTISFFTEGQAVVDFTSNSQQIPSNYYFSCVEDSKLIIGGSEENTLEMYEKFPKLLSITRNLMEQDYGKSQENFATFITSSPEDRYLNLLETRPELLQRVPQHQIASYLGMTPESLSRIRKRILKAK